MLTMLTVTRQVLCQLQQPLLFALRRGYVTGDYAIVTDSTHDTHLVASVSASRTVVAFPPFLRSMSANMFGSNMKGGGMNRIPRGIGLLDSSASPMPKNIIPGWPQGHSAGGQRSRRLTAASFQSISLVFLCYSWSRLIAESPLIILEWTPFHFGCLRFLLQNSVCMRMIGRHCSFCFCGQFIKIRCPLPHRYSLRYCYPV